MSCTKDVQAICWKTLAFKKEHPALQNNTFFHFFFFCVSFFPNWIRIRSQPTKVNADPDPPHWSHHILIVSHTTVLTQYFSLFTYSFLYFFGVLVCLKPLLRLCRPFCIFERCLRTQSAAVVSRCATNLQGDGWLR